MDEEKFLILDCREGERDITSQVESFTPDGHQVGIVFKNCDKVFSYSRSNLFISDRPQEITTDIAIDGKIRLGTQKKLRFGSVLKLFFPGRREVHTSGYEVLKTRDAKQMEDTLAYLLEVAKLVKVINPENEKQTSNTMIVDAIAGIGDPEVDSPLYSYLSGSVKTKSRKTEDLIFPFSCNQSQLTAVEQCFSNNLSLIQGPPGTGKTQTILNILVNAVIRDKKVAIVSNNNSALQNIVDKLAAADSLNFIAAFLGNRQNRDAFVDEQSGYPPWLAEEPHFTSDDRKDLNRLRQEIKCLFAAQNELKIKQSQLKSWQIEADKFARCYPEFPRWNFIGTAEELLCILARCSYWQMKNKKIPVWFKIRQVYFRKRWSFSFWGLPIEKIIVILKSLCYQKKCFELQNEIASLSELLENTDFEAKHRELNQLSWRMLKYSLHKKYARKAKKRPVFSKHELGEKEFFKEYPVLLSTTFMIKEWTPKKGFDLLIMDEASQVDICTGAAALDCAAQAVIVGDEKQLPCVITAEDENILAVLNSQCTVDPAFQYRSGQSILSSLQQAIPGIANVTLKEHYRCHPDIIGFCNQRFYNGSLIIHSKPEVSPALNVLYMKPGNHAFGHTNQRQCDEIIQLQKRLTTERKITPDSIGICSPYREQADKLGGNTIHKFQGREKDVIIFSTVDNQISKFASDEQLINVAVSRAKKEFYLVVNSSNKNWDNCIGDLVNYVKYHDRSGKSEISGKISSVFDLLYSEYQNIQVPELEKWLFDSPAEKIIYNTLTKILEKNDAVNRLAFQMHIPLLEIFKSDINLTEEEKRYFNNSNTHVDFVVYERFGRTPILGIEVDGSRYHRKGTKQYQNDMLKNRIFEKNRLDLLRLSTKESNEVERIKAALFKTA